MEYKISSEIGEPIVKANLIPATLSDYPVVQNMARFYVYEMSRDCGLDSKDWACPADGLYESFDYKQYFTDKNKLAYLIKVEDELAGFALIYQTGEKHDTQWHIGEFFILARFQRRGIGIFIAQQIWQKHPGNWELTVIPENHRALQFWRKAISRAPYHFIEELKLKEGRADPSQPNRIFLSFNTKAYKAQAMSTIQILPASFEQQQVIAQLYELYTYEMTDLADFDIHDNGYYGYKDLPLYWIDHNRHPFLIWVNNKLAGFALVQKGSPITNEPNVWDIAEFFIMRRFRQKGIGRFVANQLWQQFKGDWQIRVWDNNKIAYDFWDSAIEGFTKKVIRPLKQVYQGHDGLLVYKFHSPYN